MNIKPKNNIFKILTTLLVGVLLSGSVLFATPRISTAGMPVIDVAALVNLVNGFVKEYVTDFVAWTITDVMISLLNIETTGWANTSWSSPSGGGGGNSTFITNPKEFFDHINLGVTNNFREIVGLIEGEIIIDGLPQMITEAERALNEGVSGRLKTTVDTEVLKSFIENAGDGMSFTASGGWQSWIDMTRDPVNYHDGAILIATAELDSLKESAVQRFRDELAQGGGFLSIRDCVSRGTGDPNADEFGCLQYENVTPGSMVAERVSAVFSGDYARAEQADELSEVLSSVIGGFIDNMVKNGLSTVGGSSSCNLWGTGEGEGMGCINTDDAEYQETIAKPCADLRRMADEIARNKEIELEQKTTIITNLLDQVSSIGCSV